MEHPTVQGIHDLVVHDYGPGRCMISLHVEVPGNENVFLLHDMIDNIERELDSQLGCEAVIHMDPIETDNAEIKRMHDLVEQKVKEINEKITIHDFRMVTGDTHTNLIFDAVIPYKTKGTPEALQDQIKQKVKEIGDQYIAVVQLDQSYVPID